MSHGSNAEARGPASDDLRARNEARSSEPGGKSAGLLQKFGVSRRIPDDGSFSLKEQETLREIENLVKDQKLEDIQFELARLACLIPAIKTCAEPNRVDYVKLAVVSLSGKEPNKDFAKIIRSELEFQVLRSQRGMFHSIYRISGTTPLSAMLSGVLMSAICMAAFAILIAVLVQPGMDGRSGLWSDRLIFHMSILAAAGGFISVLSRLNHFAAIKAYDPFLFFSTGFFKPWIGVGFSVFLYFLLKSEIIKISGLESSNSNASYAFLVLAFISEFSERFVSDFITKAEDRILGPSSVPKTARPPAP